MLIQIIHLAHHLHEMASRAVQGNIWCILTTDSILPSATVLGMSQGDFGLYWRAQLPLTYSFGDSHLFCFILIPSVQISEHLWLNNSINFTNDEWNMSRDWHGPGKWWFVMIHGLSLFTYEPWTYMNFSNKTNTFVVCAIQDSQEHKTAPTWVRDAKLTAILHLILLPTPSKFCEDWIWGIQYELELTKGDSPRKVLVSSTFFEGNLVWVAVTHTSNIQSFPNM